MPISTPTNWRGRVDIDRRAVVRHRRPLFAKNVPPPRAEGAAHERSEQRAGWGPTASVAVQKSASLSLRVRHADF